jgi:hypothetical protein
MRTAYAAKKFRAVAFHEAGHAVFACLMNIEFVNVKIFPKVHPTPPGGAVLGALDLQRDWPDWAIPESKSYDGPRALQYVAQDICMTLAGDLAESLHTGRGKQPIPADEDDDEEIIESLGDLLNLAPAETRKWRARLWFLTLEILHLPAVWNAVTCVAEELFRRKSLTYAQVQHMADETLARHRIAVPMVKPYGPLLRSSRAIKHLAPRLASLLPGPRSRVRRKGKVVPITAGWRVVSAPQCA